MFVRVRCVARARARNKLLCLIKDFKLHVVSSFNCYAALAVRCWNGKALRIEQGAPDMPCIACVPQRPLLCSQKASNKKLGNG